MKVEPFIFSHLFHYLFVRGDSGLELPVGEETAHKCGFYLSSNSLSRKAVSFQQVKTTTMRLLSNSYVNSI